MGKVVVCAVAAMMLATWACTRASQEQGDTGSVTTVTYRCDGNETVTVDYDNSDPELPLAWVQLSPENPEKLKMTLALSASGARYTDGKLVWWTKGKTAFLTKVDSEEAPIYDGCNELEQVE
jgi:membrane-bound inhibitor of C-type lysozyme